MILFLHTQTKYLLLNILNSSVLISLISLFFTLGLTCLIFVLGLRKVKKIQQAYTFQLKEKCQILIAELIFDEKLTPESQEMEDYFLKNRSRKQLFLEELMSLHKSLQGEFATAIEQYYLSKNFDKLSFKKLKSEKNYKILQGLDELVEMKNRESIEVLNKLLSQTIDYSLKNYLMLAIIKLDPENGLKGLFIFDNYLTDWLQLRIIKILDEMKFINPPPLSAWIEKGGSFAVFGCRLTAYTKAEKDIPLLRKLLKKNNETLKIEAINTLGILDAQEVNELLIKIYFSETVVIKEAILNTLGMFKNPNNYSFFVSCSKANTHETQLLALNGINLLIEQGLLSPDKHDTQTLHFNQLNKINAIK